MPFIPTPKGRQHDQLVEGDVLLDCVLDVCQPTVRVLWTLPPLALVVKPLS